MRGSRLDDRIFLVINILMIALGMGYALSSFGLHEELAIVSEIRAAEIETTLLSVWLLSVVAWLILLRRRALQQARRRTKQKNNIRRMDLNRHSTMQKQWNHSEIQTTWPDTLHDTRDRLTSFERQSTGLNFGSDTVSRWPSTRPAYFVDSESSRVPSDWTLDLLQQLEWQRFEDICVEFFRSIGLEARSMSAGPIGDATLRIADPSDPKPNGLAKVSAGAGVVGLAAMQNLYAALSREDLKQGFYLTAGAFSVEAIAAARGVGIFPIDGTALLAHILALPVAPQEALLKRSVRGDFRTPSCPTCGNKMALRQADSKEFWRCGTFPACKTRLAVNKLSAGGMESSL